MLNHPYKKKWGQNFIQDKNIIKKIIKVINPQKDDRIIEIGPGSGALTYNLINDIEHLIAIEIDPLLCSYLEQKANNTLKIINQDILEVSFNKYKNYNKIIGNLPYYITTPIIFKILKYQFWEKIVIMVQKEVADRIISEPGNKIYGRLSVMVQSICKVSKKFDISKNIFYPKPNVDSSLIELTFKKNVKIKNFQIFTKIVKAAFGQRRKMLKNSLKDIIPIDSYNKYAYNRPEQLTVSNYVEISNNI